MTTYRKECNVCHHLNPLTANFCEGQGCVASLVGARIVDLDAPLEAPNTASDPPGGSGDALAAADVLSFHLAEDPGRVFRVAPGQTLGAPGHSEEPDVPLAGVPGEDYISGRHLRVLRRGPDWFVQHVGHTNYIVVDGTRYEGRNEVRVRAGSSVFLTETEFVIGGGERR